MEENHKNTHNKTLFWIFGSIAGIVIIIATSYVSGYFGAKEYYESCDKTNDDQIDNQSLLETPKIDKKLKLVSGHISNISDSELVLQTKLPNDNPKPPFYDDKEIKVKKDENTKIQGKFSEEEDAKDLTWEDLEKGSNIVVKSTESIRSSTSEITPETIFVIVGFE